MKTHSINLDLERRVRERTEALRCALEEMHRLSDEKDAFLSQVSHELRTPLNAILGHAQLLRSSDLSPKQSGHVDMLIRAGGQLRDLLNDLLDISCIQSGRLRMTMEPVLVADVIREASGLMAPEAAVRGVDVAIEPISTQVEYVAADRRRLTQVVVNLLSNALKYNRPGGRVTVATFAAATRVCLEISDTGVGIPPEQLGRLFEPFERLGVERTGIEGTGLGLALSRQLVTAMGGSIEVESRYGEGTTFRVQVLSAARRVADRHVTGLRGSRTARGQDAVRSLLYIEDNLDNVRLMEEVLEWSGFQVRLIPAGRGGIGIELAHERRPDLILLDLRLPDMHGDEALRRLKQDAVTATIPVIVVTADADPGMAETLLRHGARACLTKPYQIDGLVTLVDDVLGQNPCPGATTFARGRGAAQSDRAG